MYHIFRWRREYRNENTTSSDLSTDQEHKKAHSRRHRLRVYHDRQPFERLFHFRRQRPPTNQRQVTISNKIFL